ncbi:MAG: ATP synthase subunit I [Faecalibacterium sp.]|nr:ATP synthase subunit I [Faecalibacterium sp.]
MRFEPEVKKTLKQIAAGIALCTAVLWVVFAALQLLGLTRLDLRVVLSSVLGAAVALANFVIICVTSTKYLDMQDEDQRKKFLTLSHNLRMLLQAGWVVLCIALGALHLVAGVAPLLFPRITIYYLQITGKYRPQKTKTEEITVDETIEIAPVEELEFVDTAEDEGGET